MDAITLPSGNPLTQPSIRSATRARDIPGRLSPELELLRNQGKSEGSRVGSSWAVSHVEAFGSRAMFRLEDSSPLGPKSSIPEALREVGPGEKLNSR